MEIPCVCVCAHMRVGLLSRLPSVGGPLTDVPLAEVWSRARWEEGP